jgi:hypothetical protein
MKKIILTAFFLFTFTANASSTKVCFFSEGDLFGRKGDRFLAEVASRKLKIEDLKGNSWPGTYTRKNEDHFGRDGKVYLNFWANGDEGCNTILVDEALIHDGAMGLIKFRCRGEGFGESKFFCRDESN